MRRPEFSPVDPGAVPLEGMHLVEASAGTGKTWTITALYLRLVTELGLQPEQILVMTFTRAATAELAERIRRRLLEAEAAFAGAPAGDPFLAELVARHPEPELAARRLRLALPGMDLAAIRTIHGFCQQALADTAFEGGAPFEAELTAEPEPLLEQAVDDFWRREMGGAHPLWATYLAGRHEGPDSLRAWVARHIARPFQRVDGPGALPDWAPTERAAMDAFGALREAWTVQRDAVIALLAGWPGLSRQRYKPQQIEAAALAMDEALAAGLPPAALPEAMRKFGAASIAASLNKGAGMPGHALFGACQAFLDAHDGLSQAYALRLRDLRARLIAWCDAELPRRKAQQGLRAYDDLLLDLRRALAGEGGERLAGALRARYRAALIDEFQDTDPVQLDIFRRIYGEGGLPVFLVGDPKQAIYAFRGADVFAYLQAYGLGVRAWSLDSNWRSVPPLTHAVNTLFTAHGEPFLLPEIGFREAVPARRDWPVLEEDGAPAAPLRLWLLPDAGGKPHSKESATAMTVQATAGEVARLLAASARGAVRLDGRALAGSDIAVLVRSHREAAMLRQALAAHGVNAVTLTQESVFHAREAEELARVLAAVAEPALAGRIRSALATALLGREAADIAALEDDEAGWQACVEAFRQDHRQWRERGFMPMLRALMAREGVAARLLALPDGERRLTNLLHLAELANAALHEQRLGVEGALRWLAARRAEDRPGGEAALLRLESERELVRIVTMHSAKGLEFPIVFCPFLWQARDGKDEDEALLWHDPGEGWRAALDLGSPRRAAAEQAARREELAESLRLAYVALTRAQVRCYTAWGRVSQGGRSPLAWLLHRPSPEAGPETVDAAWSQLGDARLRDAVGALAAKAPECIAVEDLPPAAPAEVRAAAVTGPALEARRHQHPLPAAWRVASFTSLAAGLAAELPDHDALAAGGEGGGPGIFGFPRGAGPGTCLHALLERLDFACRDPVEVQALAAPLLARHGIEARWAPEVAAMALRVTGAPLDEAGAIRLAEVPRGRRADELGFYYPLARISPEGLRAVLGRHGMEAAFRERIEGLAFAPADGYMKGFVDLVFEAGGRWWLADYKSNWLGPAPEHYDPQRLPEAMAREAYPLQYLVYAVALHRMLRLRVPGYDYERHFGGVFYLFLRGMDPGRPGCGVFRDRPSAALVEDLDRYFGEGAR